VNSENTEIESVSALVARQVEQEFKRSLNHAAEGIHWIGADGVILWANQTELDLLGYSGAEYVGRHISEFHLDKPCIEDILARLARGETLHHHPARLRHKDGSVRHVAISSNVLWEGDTFVRTQCFTRDLTGQNLAHAAARRLAEIVDTSDARDRLLVDLDDAVRPLSDAEEITFTAATLLGRHLGANRCAYATVEEDQDTFTLTGNFNDGVHSIVGRYTFRQFGAECLRLMRAGEPYVVCDSSTDPRIDQHDRPSYIQTAITGVICVPVMKQGRFVAAMAVHTTTARSWLPAEVALVQRVAHRCWESIERARVTQSLKHSEARFRTVASTNSALTLYEQDQDLRYTWVFPSHPEFASDNIGKTDTDLLPPGEGEQLSALKRAVLTTGVGQKAEITVTLPNDVRTYDLVIEPRRDAAGTIIGVGGVAVDISERKKNELLLARAQDIARESAERLRDADRRKDEFLAILAHELRNPLAPIRTGLHLIRISGDTPASVTKVRSMMERQVAHIVRLVDDLLDVSRITSGKIHLQRETVTVQELVDGAIEVNRPLIDSAGIVLDVNLPKTCGLFVDRTRMIQIISNVLNNAVKFTAPGGRITIEAAVEPTVQPGHVTITIADTGSGISPAMMPRLFELFAQGEQGTTRMQGGLGIGLALAKALLEMHGGTIAAQSEGIGQGSTFRIRVPISPDENRNDAVEKSRPSSAQGLRVLVVDDNDDAATMLVMLVQQLGGQGRSAADGEAAVRQALEFKPDVVLLDIGLPGMDGYETCRRIRDQYGKGLKIVAITGWGQEHDKRLALDAGFDAHLTKPADLLALERLLTSFAAGLT
jgi:PAS domain S-box-containing protein